MINKTEIIKKEEKSKDAQEQILFQINKCNNNAYNESGAKYKQIKTD